MRAIIRISRAVTIILFLALIRSIIEPLRSSISGAQLQALIVGCLIAATGCLIITFLSFYAKHVAIITTGLLTLAVLVVFKTLYM